MEDFFEYCDEVDFPIHKETKYLKSVRFPPPGTFVCPVGGIYEIHCKNEIDQWEFWIYCGNGEWIEPSTFFIEARLVAEIHENDVEEFEETFPWMFKSHPWDGSLHTLSSQRPL